MLYFAYKPTDAVSPSSEPNDAAPHHDGLGGVFFRFETGALGETSHRMSSRL